MSEIRELFRRANRALATAKLNLDDGDNDACASRSYYAMFYAAEAVLLTKEMDFSSHRSVISLFGQHFTKNGLLPRGLSRDLNKAFEDRMKGDYGIEYKTPHETAVQALSRAENFVGEIKRYLVKEGYEL